MQARGLIRAPSEEPAQEPCPHRCRGVGAGAPGPRREVGLCGVRGGEPQCSRGLLLGGLQTSWTLIGKCTCVCMFH